MGIINDADATEAAAAISTIKDLDAKRAAHESGDAKLSVSDYMDFGQQRADAVLAFAKKFGLAYNDAQVAAWYQDHTG